MNNKKDSKCSLIADNKIILHLYYRYYIAIKSTTGATYVWLWISLQIPMIHCEEKKNGILKIVHTYIYIPICVYVLCICVYTYLHLYIMEVGRYTSKHTYKCILDCLCIKSLWNDTDRESSIVASLELGRAGWLEQKQKFLYISFVFVPFEFPIRHNYHLSLIRFKNKSDNHYGLLSGSQFFPLFMVFHRLHCLGKQNRISCLCELGLCMCLQQPAFTSTGVGNLACF
jgi:hypothetical protein